MHFTLSVNVFCTNVLIEDPIFTSPARGLPSHANVWQFISSLHFILVFFRPWAIGTISGIEAPATSKRTPAIEKKASVN